MGMLFFACMDFCSGHPDLQIKGKGFEVFKKFCSVLRVSLWSKNKGMPSPGSSTGFVGLENNDF